MNPKPILRLVIVTQIFLLFMAVLLPALIRYLHQPVGKCLYGLLAIVCVLLAVLLRRMLSTLD